MRTLASILLISLAAPFAAADNTLTDENFLGIWKTTEIGDAKHKNRAILVLPDRLIDITNVDAVKPVTTEFDSCTVNFVALAVDQKVVQCVLKYHAASSVERGRLTIRQLEDQQAEIRYTLTSTVGKRWFSKYKVERYEAGKTPPQLVKLVKQFQREASAKANTIVDVPQ
ncbi:MAG: hypothetical protein AAF989_15895 [Planctomycetota bacterium]